MTQYDKEYFLKWKGRTTIRTIEGTKAVKEAIEFMEKAKPVGLLKWSDPLSQAS